MMREKMEKKSTMRSDNKPELFAEIKKDAFKMFRRYERQTRKLSS